MVTAAWHPVPYAGSGYSPSDVDSPLPPPPKFEDVLASPERGWRPRREVALETPEGAWGDERQGSLSGASVHTRAPPMLLPRRLGTGTPSTPPSPPVSAQLVPRQGPAVDLYRRGPIGAEAEQHRPRYGQGRYSPIFGAKARRGGGPTAAAFHHSAPVTSRAWTQEPCHPQVPQSPYSHDLRGSVTPGFDVSPLSPSCSPETRFAVSHRKPGAVCSPALPGTHPAHQPRRGAAAALRSPGGMSRDSFDAVVSSPSAGTPASCGTHSDGVCRAGDGRSPPPPTPVCDALLDVPLLPAAEALLPSGAASPSPRDVHTAPASAPSRSTELNEPGLPLREVPLPGDVLVDPSSYSAAGRELLSSAASSTSASHSAASPNLLPSPVRRASQPVLFETTFDTARPLPSTSDASMAGGWDAASHASQGLLSRGTVPIAPVLPQSLRSGALAAAWNELELLRRDEQPSSENVPGATPCNTRSNTPQRDPAAAAAVPAPAPSRASFTSDETTCSFFSSAGAAPALPQLGGWALPSRPQTSATSLTASLSRVSTVPGRQPPPSTSASSGPLPLTPDVRGKPAPRVPGDPPSQPRSDGRRGPPSPHGGGVASERRVHPSPCTAALPRSRRPKSTADAADAAHSLVNSHSVSSTRDLAQPQMTSRGSCSQGLPPAQPESEAASSLSVPVLSGTRRGVRREATPPSARSETPQAASPSPSPPPARREPPASPRGASCGAYSEVIAPHIPAPGPALAACRAVLHGMECQDNVEEYRDNRDVYAAARPPAPIAAMDAAASDCADVSGLQQLLEEVLGTDEARPRGAEQGVHTHAAPAYTPWRPPYEERGTPPVTPAWRCPAVADRSAMVRVERSGAPDGDRDETWSGGDGAVEDDATMVTEELRGAAHGARGAPGWGPAAVAHPTTTIGTLYVHNLHGALSLTDPAAAASRSGCGLSLLQHDDRAEGAPHPPDASIPHDVPFPLQAAQSSTLAMPCPSQTSAPPRSESIPAMVDDKPGASAAPPPPLTEHSVTTIVCQGARASMSDYATAASHLSAPGSRNTASSSAPRTPPPPPPPAQVELSVQTSTIVNALQVAPLPTRGSLSDGPGRASRRAERESPAPVELMEHTSSLVHGLCLEAKLPYASAEFERMRQIDADVAVDAPIPDSFEAPVPHHAPYAIHLHPPPPNRASSAVSCVSDTCDLAPTPVAAPAAHVHLPPPVEHLSPKEFLPPPRPRRVQHSDTVHARSSLPRPSGPSAPPGEPLPLRTFPHSHNLQTLPCEAVSSPFRPSGLPLQEVRDSEAVQSPPRLSGAMSRMHGSVDLTRQPPEQGGSSPPRGVPGPPVEHLSPKEVLPLPKPRGPRSDALQSPPRQGRSCLPPSTSPVGRTEGQTVATQTSRWEASYGNDGFVPPPVSSRSGSCLSRPTDDVRSARSGSGSAASTVPRAIAPDALLAGIDRGSQPPPEPPAKPAPQPLPTAADDDALLVLAARQVSQRRVAQNLQRESEGPAFDEVEAMLQSPVRPGVLRGAATDAEAGDVPVKAAEPPAVLQACPAVQTPLRAGKGGGRGTPARGTADAAPRGQAARVPVASKSPRNAKVSSGAGKRVAGASAAKSKGRVLHAAPSPHAVKEKKVAVKGNAKVRKQKGVPASKAAAPRVCSKAATTPRSEAEAAPAAISDELYNPFDSVGGGTPAFHARPLSDSDGDDGLAEHLGWAVRTASRSGSRSPTPAPHAAPPPPTVSPSMNPYNKEGGYKATLRGCKAMAGVVPPPLSLSRVARHR